MAEIRSGFPLTSVESDYAPKAGGTADYKEGLGTEAGVVNRSPPHYTDARQRFVPTEMAAASSPFLGSEARNHWPQRDLPASLGR